MRTITIFNRLLFLFLAFIGALIFARIIYTQTTDYLFLVWNLFLAWIPYVMSGLFSRYQQRENYKQMVIFVSWLVFFPNALYIVTDLIHLQEETAMPLWYDALLLFASSFAGLMMAFISLHRAESFLEKIFSKRVAIVLVPVIVFLGAFGVYLGRFQRWNSWNIVNDPLALAIDIFSMIASPHDNIKTWAVTAILTVLYLLLYFFIKIIPQAFSDTLPGSAPYDNY